MFLTIGFKTNDFKIAVVVMAQIASEVSGVGFSINPLNNDYDEAIITSNWGLGETVVGGIVNPDQFIVNKIYHDVLDTKIGKKEISIILNPEGGTQKIEDPRHDQPSLDKNMLCEVLKQIIAVEKYYNLPVDIEWAFFNEQLYLLQARPVTTYYGLPKIMQTRPTQKRNLYLDISLVVQGAEKPYSVLGGSILNIFLSYFGQKVLGSNPIDIRNQIAQCVGGRIYVNLSNIWSKISVEAVAGIFNRMNPKVAEIFKDSGCYYISETIPECLKFTMIGMAWRLPITKILFPSFFMNKIKSNVISGQEEFHRIYDNLFIQFNKKEITLRQLVIGLIDKFTDFLRGCMLPAMKSGNVNGLFLIQGVFEKYLDNPEVKNQVNELIRSLPNNITTQMGLDLYEISLNLDKDKYANYEVLEKEYEENTLPKTFFTKWQNFMNKYGFRGINELDIFSPRFYDDPKSILKQVHNLLLNSTEESNPFKVFQTAEKNRPIVFEKLNLIATQNNFSREFKKAFDLCYNLAGFRETPKYNIIKILGGLRKIIKVIGNDWNQLGILNNKDDIFGLEVFDICDILESKNLLNKEHIMNIINNKKVDRDIFMNSQRATPPVIDSRGRILTPKPVQAKPGELVGQSVSFGVVQGRVKVIHYVNEKSLIPGEILVTRATDPGWTPLIINSKGIILEIGGMLQHGAVVSREFNKPCVVGIENVMNILKDGDLIELDAINGIVRKLEDT